MTKIFKYPLKIVDEQIVMMPGGARILSVGNQFGDLVLWARVIPSEPLVPRHFVIHGIGHPSDATDDATFLGTVLTHDGALSWHVFEAAP